MTRYRAGRSLKNEIKTMFIRTDNITLTTARKLIASVY